MPLTHAALKLGMRHALSQVFAMTVVGAYKGCNFSVGSRGNGESPKKTTRFHLSHPRPPPRQVPNLYSPLVVHLSPS